MKKTITHTRQRSFGSLVGGNVFMHEDKIFVKVKAHDYSNDKRNAICIEDDGIYAYEIHDTCMVQRIAIQEVIAEIIP